MPHFLALLTICTAYLIGAVPFGYLIARARGVDILRVGSGNIGATNVGRVLGRPFGVLVFALDFAKGAGPVLAAIALKGVLADTPLWTGGWVEVGAGLAAFLGHLFPVYLGFRGGKGVATGAGVVAVLLPVPALVGLVTWIVVVASTRTVSLASIAATLALGAAQLSRSWPPDLAEPRTLFALLAAGLVVLRHRSNLVRLAQGRENQLEDRPAMFQTAKVLHVLAVGLWFGTAVFFHAATGQMIDTFKALGRQEQRPNWFPLPAEFARADATLDGPQEQGSRAFGYAVGPMFAWYYPLQGACGLIALLPALAWLRRFPGRAHRWRATFLVVALALTLVGWPIARHVGDLRDPRNEATDAYLRADSSQIEAARREMQSVRAEFARWHTYSLLLDLIATGCVGVVLALAANLPERTPAV